MDAWDYAPIGLVALGALMASGILPLIPYCAYSLLGACVVPVSLFGLPLNLVVGILLVGLGAYLFVRARRDAES